MKTVENDQELEFDNDLEEEVEEIPTEATGRKIYTDKSDPTIDSLHGKFKKGRLVLQPDFQRQVVWDKKKASRLVESVLLDVPLPTIYLAEEHDSKVSVIDGQQRLTAFFAYIDGIWPVDKTDFKLSGLQVNRDLNKKLYKDLQDDIQEKIKDATIRTITFKKDSDPNLRFEIFERLNTGSVPLNDQELRNCVYRGSYMSLLKELSVDADFTHLLGLTKPDKRMNDIELVLRFCAFYHSTFLKYKPPMRKFLNDDMERFKNMSEKDKAELRATFKCAVQNVRSLLDKNAFKRFYKGDDKSTDGYWEPKKFNASLYDILMYTLSMVDKNQVYQNLDSIREALIDLMVNDQEFIDAIELSTSSLQAVTKRFDKWRHTLQQVIGATKKETRCFTYRLKQELYTADPSCKLCKNKIQHIDDAAVDHIEQYWLGGKTIPANARLTHRYCNNARPRKE